MAPENRSKKPTGKKTSGKSTSGKDKKTESGKSESGEMEFDGNVFDETDEDFVNEGNTREAGAEDGNVDENYVKGNENNDAGEGNAGEGSDTAEEGEAEDKLTRLNKFISNAGVTARRKADDLIFTGRVTVNMKTVTEPGTRVDPDKDVVKVDGEKVKPQSEYIYVVLFKPRGYVTTTSDDKGRPTVMDLIGLNTRLYPIGRLDYDTDGVLLLTNDGEFSNMMMHPRHKIFKTYFAKLDKPIEEHDARKLKEGVVIDGRPTSRAKVRIIPNTGEQNIWISIHEGRNRQVRRMLEALGYIVQRLKRVEYARIGLDDLKPGDWRYMTPEEVDAARKLATPKPVQVRREPVVKPEDGAPVQQVKVTGKKGGKKKKKLKKLEKMQQKMAVKQQQSGSQQSNSQQQNMQQPAQQKVQPSTGSDVLDSISKELEEIKEQISDTSQDVKSE
jgi:23S rRNA pseudouridine2605 synthase